MVENDSEQRRVLGEHLKSIVAIDRSDWDRVTDSTQARSFSFTVPREPETGVGRNSACLIVGGYNDDGAMFIGIIKSTTVVSTLSKRISITKIDSVQPESVFVLKQMLGDVPQRELSLSAAANGATITRISPFLGKSIVEILFQFAENRAKLARLYSALTVPARFVDARALQTSAIGDALEAFGIHSNAEAIYLALTDRYSGLGSVRVQEDAIINHDARWMPGLHLVDSDITGKAIFESAGERLEVYTANRLSLERLFGVDLIYHNVARESIIMVQYKMLESTPRPGSQRSGIDSVDWIFYPDEQFDIEIAKMSTFASAIPGNGPYRLNQGAFYLKFFRREAATNTAGIVISLDHFNELRAKEFFRGPRGGVRLSYDALENHYLRSGPFVGLIRAGYIGTTGATTKYLETLITNVSSIGRPLVAAIQSPIAR